jgi:D-glycero-alpha-D-manno-heptose-7-phosphate kinase
MDDLIETALNSGAVAAKVCGAGGGGCIAFYCEAGKKPDVEKALSNAKGSEVLKFGIQTTGLQVKTQ